MFFVVVYFFYLIEREAGLFESFDIQTRCKSCEHDDQSLLELPTDAEPPMLEIKADKPKLQLPERVEPIESDDKPLVEKAFLTRKERRNKKGSRRKAGRF